MLILLLGKEKKGVLVLYCNLCEMPETGDHHGSVGHLREVSRRRLALDLQECTRRRIPGFASRLALAEEKARQEQCAREAKAKVKAEPQ